MMKKGDRLIVLCDCEPLSAGDVVAYEFTSTDSNFICTNKGGGAPMFFRVDQVTPLDEINLNKLTDRERMLCEAVVAKRRGLNVEVTSDDGWHSSTLININHFYRIKPKSTPLPITAEMWTIINPKIKFMVVDGDGFVYGSSAEPTFQAGEWLGGSVCTMYDMKAITIDTTGIVAELSMTKRPEDV